MKAMCEFFAVSRAAYYEWVKTLVEPDPNQMRMEQVQAAYEASHRTYGYRRITLDLQQKQGLHQSQGSFEVDTCTSTQVQVCTGSIFVP